MKLIPLPPFSSWLASNVPTTFDNTMSYYDELTSLIKYIESVIIPELNKVSEKTDGLLKEFQDLKDYVDAQIKDIPQLRQDFEVLKGQFDAFVIQVEHELELGFANLTERLVAIVNTFKTEIEADFAREIARLDNKIDTFVLTDTMVYNTIRGEYTPIQTYLDDLSQQYRSMAITAGEYDGLQLTATNYDSRAISAYDYDNIGKTILMGS